MTYFIVVIVSFALLLGFLTLSWLETKSGFRIFGGMRRRFDRKVGRAAFIATHIDWESFVAHVVRSNAERLAHDVVHTVLLLVRATERTLTKLIRNLRERVANHEPQGEPVEGSQLIATIVRFRKNLRKDRPTDR